MKEKSESDKTETVIVKREIAALHPQELESLLFVLEKRSKNCYDELEEELQEYLVAVPPCRWSAARGEPSAKALLVIEMLEEEIGEMLLKLQTRERMNRPYVRTVALVQLAELSKISWMLQHRGRPENPCFQHPQMRRRAD